MNILLIASVVCLWYNPSLCTDIHGCSSFQALVLLIEHRSSPSQSHAGGPSSHSPLLIFLIVCRSPDSVSHHFDLGQIRVEPQLSLSQLLKLTQNPQLRHQHGNACSRGSRCCPRESSTES